MTPMNQMPPKPTENNCGFIRDLPHETFQKIFGNHSLALHTQKPMLKDDVNALFNTDKVPYEIVRRWTKGHVVWFEARYDISDSVVNHIAEAVNANLAPELYVVDNVYIVVSDYPERPGDIRVAGFCR